MPEDFEIKIMDIKSRLKGIEQNIGCEMGNLNPLITDTNNSYLYDSVESVIDLNNMPTMSNMIFDKSSKFHYNSTDSDANVFNLPLT